MRDFGQWLSEFRPSIANYGYYVDFQKVYGNVESMKVELHILNSLIGSKSIEKDFYQLAERYPEVLKCIPLLLAVRNAEIYCQDEDGGQLYTFKPKDLKKRKYRLCEVCLFYEKNRVVRFIGKSYY